jgi:hypothetical protein
MNKEWINPKTEDWVPLLTLQDVAAAQARGDEIEVEHPREPLTIWVGKSWSANASYRSRPRKKTKTIVLREALIDFKDSGWFLVKGEKEAITRIYGGQVIKWLDTPAREFEIEE